MESMEKKLFLRRFAAFYASVLMCLLFSANLAALQQLRFQLWAHLEEVPLNEKASRLTESPYSLAIENLKKNAPFFVEGMLYGWNFSYTPSDVLRGVKEYFEFEPVAKIEVNDPRLVFDSPFHEEGRLYCWVTYSLSPEQERLINSWQSVVYPKIQGSGSASIFDGYEGIRSAYAAAIQSAVRSYARGLIKNKPKEITGTVIFDGQPRLRVVSGQYVSDVTLYLAIKEIIPHSIF